MKIKKYELKNPLFSKASKTYNKSISKYSKKQKYEL